MNALPEFMTRREAARLIGITPEALFRHLQLNHLPHQRLGRAIAIRCSDVREFIQKRANGLHRGKGGRPRKQKEEAID